MVKSPLLRIMAFLGMFIWITIFGYQPVALSAPGGSLAVPGVGFFGLPEWLEAKEAKGLENQTNAGLQYDLTGLSKDTWHYARLVSYKMEQNLGVAALLWGAAEANPQLVGDLVRPLLTKSLEENGGRILDWSPAKKASFGGRNVPVINARLILTEKVPLPMAATVYVFMHQDRLFAVGLLSPDSDRVFWAQHFKKMTASMRWE